MNASETKSTLESRRLEILQLAREQQSEEGRVEIDDNAVVSDGDHNDNGCYVAAWVWVGFEGTKFDKEQESKAGNQPGRD
jgi:hypothetical protein